MSSALTLLRPKALAQLLFPWKCPSMKRRDFLLGSLASVLYVACGSDAATNQDEPSKPGGNGSSGGAVDASAPDADAAPFPPPRPTSNAADSDRVFPQGLASGDPRPDRVLLWGRIEAENPALPLDLGFVIALDEALTQIVKVGTVTALPEEDHTVRVIPTGLEPGTVYWYRFEHEDVTTRVARTKTAPAPSADVTVKYAMCACQDYIGRYWHSWQALLEENEDLDFVLYLGDYIYESVNDARFQNSDPSARTIVLPDGLDTSPAQDGSRIGAGTLRDYRALYKIYRSDPLLREVHRLYPFVITWDDHEFADDCWGDHSTSFAEKDPNGGGFTSEQNTPRRLAANRAFAEFAPADIVRNESAAFPGDVTIYRSLRFGKNVELFMTDQRMYRDDHVIPEGPVNLATGKVRQNSSFGARYFVRKNGFDPIEAAVAPTLLGATQKQWFLNAVTSSDATWKVWGNEVQVYQMTLDLDTLPRVPNAFSYVAYINCDQWDGYRSERAEILGALQSANVENLLVCTGDIHSFYAAELHVDFDDPGPKPIGVEYVTAGISSASLSKFVDDYVPDGDAFRPVAAAFIDAASSSLLASNPHLVHADPDSYGFTLMTVSAARVDAQFVELGDPRVEQYGGVVARTRFYTLVGEHKVRPFS